MTVIGAGRNGRRSRRASRRRRRARARAVQAQGARPAQGSARDASRWTSPTSRSARPFTSATSSRPPACEILGDKHISVLAVAAPLTEEQEAGAGTAAADGRGGRRRDDQGEEGRGRRRRRRAKAPRKPRPARARPRPEGAGGKAGRQGRAGGKRRLPPPRRRRRSRPARSSAGRAAPALSRMENLHLIVGLGNPGAEYARTRHNAGFHGWSSELARRWRAALDAGTQVQRAAGAGRARDGQRVLLCEPQTFMNASGEAVQAVAGFYQVPPDAAAGGGGRCGSAAGRDPAAARRAAAAGITGWSPSSSIWARASSPRLRIGIGRDGRTARRDHRPRAGPVQPRQKPAVGASAGAGGRPGGMLAGRTACSRP